MKELNSLTGHRGEDVAANELTKKGYQILERNYSNRFGEIDIIAQDKGTLVFVEVKSKTEDTFGTPEEMVNKIKLRKVRNMAMIYLDGKLLPCRIDVIAVVFNHENKISRLNHYENVY